METTGKTFFDESDLRIIVVNTEYANIPVSIKKEYLEGNEVFVGKILYNSLNIFTTMPTYESCKFTLKCNFEHYMDQWLNNQLKSIYEK
jgi:hypothetical protein